MGVAKRVNTYDTATFTRFFHGIVHRLGRGGRPAHAVKGGHPGLGGESAIGAWADGSQILAWWFRRSHRSSDDSVQCVCEPGSNSPRPSLIRGPSRFRELYVAIVGTVEMSPQVRGRGARLGWVGLGGLGRRRRKGFLQARSGETRWPDSRPNRGSPCRFRDATRPGHGKAAIL